MHYQNYSTSWFEDRSYWRHDGRHVHVIRKRDGNGWYVTLSSCVVMVTYSPLVDLEGRTWGRTWSSRKGEGSTRKWERRAKHSKKTVKKKNKDKRERRASRCGCATKLLWEHRKKRTKRHKVKRNLTASFMNCKEVSFFFLLNKSAVRACAHAPVRCWWSALMKLVSFRDEAHCS